MVNYKLSTKAEVDVSDIYKYRKHKFSINQAKSYDGGLHTTANKLKYFKQTWRPSFYITNGLYRYYFKSHVIFLH
jgi:plasmid stabilization system protein ParE